MSSQNLPIQQEELSSEVIPLSERPTDLIIANRDDPEPSVPVEQSSPPSERKLSLCIKIK